jgi:hypothetical protein
MLTDRTAGLSDPPTTVRMQEEKFGETRNRFSTVKCGVCCQMFSAEGFVDHYYTHSNNLPQRAEQHNITTIQTKRKESPHHI